MASAVGVWRIGKWWCCYAGLLNQSGEIPGEGSIPLSSAMNKVLEGRIRRYVDGRMPLRRFYDWYMRWHCRLSEDRTGMVERPGDDTRVTLVVYEFTSEPIASDPCREEWLKGELKNILACEGRWKKLEE